MSPQLGSASCRSDQIGKVNSSLDLAVLAMCAYFLIRAHPQRAQSVLLEEHYVITEETDFYVQSPRSVEHITFSCPSHTLTETLVRFTLTR